MSKKLIVCIAFSFSMLWSLLPLEVMVTREHGVLGVVAAQRCHIVVSLKLRFLLV